MARTFVWHPTRGPKTTQKLQPVGNGKLELTQVRSKIGHSWRMCATLEALGLKHPHDVVVHQDSASLRGQIKRVRHLINVAPAKE
ncbi:MAG: 50S ribosomal protein L30 [Gemmatimonadaceae bacterium]